MKIFLPPGSAPSHHYPFSATQVLQPTQDSPVFSPSRGLRRSTSVPVHRPSSEHVAGPWLPPVGLLPEEGCGSPQPGAKLALARA